MNWDQIETNWAAMTRRVRPERPVAGTAPQRTSTDAMNSVDGQDRTAVDGQDRTAAERSPTPRQVA
ncbi:hypothetical protein GVY41_01475 [Frigidibacter albus]|uniref:Uncharacterized protein n=1 Tax=Frigidibacter albus TaxID=1465486 RepID=A0A6L8VBY9_9RHOB|nr:hypothetical protein [Frigidibacter albus]MZQ87764.1 hypothetical protein [Frigidibacter albus]NBE29670.1 hypothetical protein [Frigidibacter albus]GGH43453.1 hypothetical protein GCM10011341_02130 [Frigidibacter albus]